MKPNRAALLLALCICLLPSRGVASLVNSPDDPMSGTYILNEAQAAEKNVNDAIEEAIRGFGPGIKKARGKLRKKNFPPSGHLTISFASGQVTIASTFGKVQTPRDGAPISLILDTENVEVRTIVIGEKTLQRIYQTKQGERVNTYSLSNDGKTLTMRVKVTSRKLPRECTYELKYVRK